MSDEDLSKKLAEYQAIAAQNQNVDISALMINALEKEQENKLSTKQKALGYFISIGFPPFGLIFAVKFYFSGTSDGKKAALYCVLLTVFTIIVTTMLLNILVSSSGQSIDQFKQAPAELNSLLQY
jgi:hypothetical protein